MSCNNSKPQTEIQTLNFGVMSSMDYVPVALAASQGYFKELNIEVNVHKFYSANDRDAAFQSDNIDGTIIDYTGAILQKAAGKDIKLTSQCNSTFFLMTANDDINSINALIGKKVSVSRNTVIDFCVEMALKSADISPEQIEKQEINKIPIRLEMMLKGETDATALPDPFYTIATQKNAKSIISMDSLGYAVTGIMFSSKAVSEKAEQIRKFYQAYNKAVEFINTHSIDDYKDILIKEIGFPENSIHSIVLPKYTSAKMPTNNDIRTVIEWLKEKNLINSDFSDKNLLDSNFISH
jgi:NitT/TauT family transport system substrate-binding protein